jgi:hypothetical protein
VRAQRVFTLARSVKPCHYPCVCILLVVCVCTLQLAQLFPDPQEWDSIQTLMAATRLLKGAPELSSSSSSSDSSNTSSSSVGAGDSLWLGEGAAESAAWAQFYSHPHASVCLMVLSSWLPEALAAGFLRSHLVSHGHTMSLPLTPPHCAGHLKQWKHRCCKISSQVMQPSCCQFMTGFIMKHCGELTPAVPCLQHAVLRWAPGC